MQPMRIYLDTSVLGGCFDSEFQDASGRLIEVMHTGKAIPLVSEVLVRELEDAPTNVRELFLRLMERDVERVGVTDEAVELHEAYLRTGVVSARYADDALHVALATVARADVLVSWNFKHLVNPIRIRGFNDVNTGQGFGSIVIMTPSDVVGMLEQADETI